MENEIVASYCARELNRMIGRSFFNRVMDHVAYNAPESNILNVEMPKQALLGRLYTMHNQTLSVLCHANIPGCYVNRVTHRLSDVCHYLYELFTNFKTGSILFVDRTTKNQLPRGELTIESPHNVTYILYSCTEYI